MTAATTNEMVIQINNSKIYKEILQNITKQNQHFEDLWQDLMLLLLTHKNKKQYLEMYNTKQFKYFFVRIIQNQFNSFSSPFAKKYKNLKLDKDNFNLDFCIYDNDEEDVERKENLEIQMEKIEKILDEEVCWYDKKLFEKYYFDEKSSYGKISKETKIPKTSVYRSVTDTFEIVKNKMNK